MVGAISADERLITDITYTHVIGFAQNVFGMKQKSDKPNDHAEWKLLEVVGSLDTPKHSWARMKNKLGGSKMGELKDGMDPPTAFSFFKRSHRGNLSQAQSQLLRDRDLALQQAYTADMI